ncbi:uncharacterized protein LOC118181272 [Stegodyphus dumicola]|uniref:uncharacterized protein LOC118181272 n=1 Tax=Stegodyphus dumicola TaxID=202533 RepID=UPI0015AA5596|nr:uncharacterized protein LOC118181272 [Stegodyphus dumicola]
MTDIKRRCFSAGRDLPHHELAATSSIYGPIDNSRPGRPPKRVSMVSMASGVTTTALVKKSRMESDYHAYENGHITGERLDKHMLPNGYGHPGTTSHLSPLPFMTLNSSHHNSVITGGVSMTTTATHSSHATSRGEITRERQMGTDVIASTRRIIQEVLRFRKRVHSGEVLRKFVDVVVEESSQKF